MCGDCEEEACHFFNLCVCVCVCLIDWWCVFVCVFLRS